MTGKHMVKMLVIALFTKGLMLLFEVVTYLTQSVPVFLKPAVRFFYKMCALYIFGIYIFAVYVLRKFPAPRNGFTSPQLVSFIFHFP